MATTIGLVQRLTIYPDFGAACVWIGPTPTNTELLVVVRSQNEPADSGAFKNSMVDALAAATVSRREVAATHSDSNAEITGLHIDPV